MGVGFIRLMAVIQVETENYAGSRWWWQGKIKCPPDSGPWKRNLARGKKNIKVSNEKDFKSEDILPLGCWMECGRREIKRAGKNESIFLIARWRDNGIINLFGRSRKEVLFWVEACQCLGNGWRLSRQERGHSHCRFGWVGNPRDQAPACDWGVSSSYPDL